MKCNLCLKETAIEFLNLGNQPLANKYPASKEQFSQEDFFPLAVFFCTTCKNVQLGTIVSRERMFEDYYYLSSVNPGLVRHFEALAQDMVSSKFVVDIGSNDGILLKPLKERGVKALGVDPSVNVGKIANDAGLETIVAFFDVATARNIVNRYGKPDVIVASSIFTHLDDPHQFIEAVKVLMAEDGRFIIEVEYIGNIISKVQFERFYLDRIFYYSLTSLKFLFESHGMFVTDVEEIEPHGGSLRITVNNVDSAGSVSGSVTAWLQKEQDELTLDKLKDFRSTVDTQLAAFREILTEYKKNGLRVAGYGAPARLTTITNYGKIGTDLVEFVVDDSPLKMNKYSPGMHVPIVSRHYLDDHTPDILIVFAYEYLDDIREKTDNRYRYLLPIPPKEIAS
jgi:SAM-dependent methyltransferase